jgi:hypothetical protein
MNLNCRLVVNAKSVFWMEHQQFTFMRVAIGRAMFVSDMLRCLIARMTTAVDGVSVMVAPTLRLLLASNIQYCTIR